MIAAGEIMALDGPTLSMTAMITPIRRFIRLCCRPYAVFFALTVLSAAAEPPRYVPATAHYILPETTSEESGYFSLSESLDGMVHVGSAKYGHNSYLVEFDPRNGR